MASPTKGANRFATTHELVENGVRREPTVFECATVPVPGFGGILKALHSSPIPPHKATNVSL